MDTDFIPWKPLFFVTRSLLCPAGGPHESYQALWFERCDDPVTGEAVHVYKGGYWEAKEQGNWDGCPDIFWPGPPGRRPPINTLLHPPLTLCSKRSLLHLVLNVLSYSSTFCFLLPPHPVLCSPLVVSSEHASHHWDELELQLLLQCPLVAAAAHTWAELSLYWSMWLVAPPPVSHTKVDMFSLHTERNTHRHTTSK